MKPARRQIEITNRRAIVAANLLAGATYREIARAVNVSPATVVTDSRAIINEWRQHYRTDADRYLSLQLRRLDTLLNALWERAVKGDPAAITSVLAIIDRQSRLLGLQQVDVSVTTVPQLSIIEINKTYVPLP